MTSLALFGPAGGVAAVVLLSLFLFLIRKGSFTLVELMVFVAIVMMIMTLLTPPDGSFEPERRAKCAANLAAIVNALHAYHDDYGCFPPSCVRDESGKPMHSWRVLILPYLGYDDLWKTYRMDEPWDSEHNRTIVETIPAEYECPGACADPGVTSYAAIVGPETIWPKDGQVCKDDVSDGLDQTMALGEVPDDLGII
ncbi:MAG: DUF1559 domain-containing protein [Pirellulales bacterium]|nr:DUF1559 domain-containing protein [Pirellulales bacterium]